MIAVVAAIASPATSATAAPTSAPACGDPTVNYAGVYGTDITDFATLRFVRVLATAEPKMRRAAIDASRVPIDPATVRAVDVALAASTSCAGSIASAAAQRMGDAVSQTWGITDDDVGERFGNRIVFIARLIAARTSIGEGVVDPLIAPFGVTVATLSAPLPTPTGDIACAAPNLQAHVVRVAQPRYPDIARATEISGKVQVKVELDDDGDVVRVSLYKSPEGEGPGPASLVESTILAAGTTLYAPQVVSCKAVTGTYIFSASFIGHR